MNLPSFKLEEFWKKYEFSSRYIFCPSSMEGWKLNEILALADPISKKMWENHDLAYTNCDGLLELREAISELYQMIKSDQICTFSGAEEGIYCTLRSLLSYQDHVIVIVPCYQSLHTIPKSIGCDMSLVSLKVESNWELEIDDIRRCIRPNTKLLIINYPHNPTGALLTKAAYHSLINLARHYGFFILCDEVYRFLEIEEKNRLPSIADCYEKGLSLHVMSKAFGLAGLRVGWIACQDRAVLNQIGAYKLYTSMSNSVSSEILSFIALKAKDVILARNRSILLNNLAMLDKFFEKQSLSLSWIRPKGGSIALVKLLLPIFIHDFAHQLKNHTGILIMPASLFDLEGNFFRIGFGKKNLPEILYHFENYLNKLYKFHY